MTYTNAANAPHTIGDTCCEDAIKTQSIKDIMDETNEIASAILFATHQINGFLFYDDHDNSEEACAPTCFKDVLLNTRNELKNALYILESIKGMLG